MDEFGDLSEKIIAQSTEPLVDDSSQIGRAHV